MKKIWSVVLMLLFAALVACDGGSVAGTYHNVANPAEIVQLGEGNTFTMKAGDKEMSGLYSVKGKKLILDSGTGVAAVGKIEGGVITDKEGVKWQKK